MPSSLERQQCPICFEECIDGCESSFRFEDCRHAVHTTCVSDLSLLDRCPLCRSQLSIVDALLHATQFRLANTRLSTTNVRVMCCQSMYAPVLRGFRLIVPTGITTVDGLRKHVWHCRVCNNEFDDLDELLADKNFRLQFSIEDCNTECLMQHTDLHQPVVLIDMASSQCRSDWLVRRVCAVRGLRQFVHECSGDVLQLPAITSCFNLTHIATAVDFDDLRLLDDDDLILPVLLH
jgi:hypothetical protein